MVIKLDAKLEAAISEQSRQSGVPPEDLALQVLRDRFIATTPTLVANDQWLSRLRNIATDCGVALSDVAVSSEGIYE